MNTYFKSITNDGGVFTIVQYYKSPTLGECHVNYLKVAAPSESEAIAVARQALA